MKKLAEYHQKRHFERTPEPAGKVGTGSSEKKLVFVIQKHAATRLHYDLRLEMDGVMKSWAVPKGPSLNPDDKRLAMHVEDHPMDYNKFEGSIPKGQYGGGEVIIWDNGSYELEGNLGGEAQIAKGDLKFNLHGKKVRGSFVLVKLKASKVKNEWLLIKHRDEFVDTSWKAEEQGQSIVTGRTLEDIKLGREAREPFQPASAKQIAGMRGARKAPMPRGIPLTLASLSDKPFSNPGWLFEVKWDGVRGIAYVSDGKVSVRSRAGREISDEYPELRELGRQLDAGEAIVDGEIVALDDAGRSVFQKLQNRSGVRNPSRALLESIPATYYAFDLLYCDGFDLRRAPLEERKALLKAILRPNEHVRYSAHEIEKGQELYEAAQLQNLEGIIGKKRDSVYVGQRTSLWLKFKIVNELDAVICGWTAPRRSREFFGALVLGLYDGAKLEFIGSVGTGFDYQTQKSVFAEVEKLRQAKSSLHEIPKLKESIEWIRPELVARVKYGNWTDGNRLRAPVFLGLHDDREPETCTMEAARRDEHADDKSANDELEEIKIPTARHGQGLEEKNSKREKSSKTRAASKDTPKASEKRPVNEAPEPKVLRASRPGEIILTEGIERELREGTSEKLHAEVEGKTLHFTHLNKIYFPESKIRKRDLLAYYFRVGPLMLPFLKDRPMVLRRYPNGITEKAFFQKEATESIPDWVERATVHSDERGGEMPYVMANDLAALLFLTNLGCIDHNPWSSRAESQDCPDYVFFDLDPTPGTPFRTVLQIARTIHEILDSIRLRCYLKTSGASGFHIFVPLEPEYTYEQTRVFAELVGRMASDELPGLITFERAVRKRPQGKVLMDALQNAKGKPLATIYSARAHPHAPVSTPVMPKELKKDIRADQWTIQTLEKRLKSVGNLWQDFWNNRQTLTEALELLEQQLSGGRKRSSGGARKR